MQKGPRNILNDLQSGPWTKEEEAGKGASQIPVRWLVGGEGQGFRELEGTMAHYLVCFGVAGMVGKVLVGGEQGAAAEANDGEGAPVRKQRV